MPFRRTSSIHPVAFDATEGSSAHPSSAHILRRSVHSPSRSALPRRPRMQHLDCEPLPAIHQATEIRSHAILRWAVRPTSQRRKVVAYPYTTLRRDPMLRRSRLRLCAWRDHQSREPRQPSRYQGPFSIGRLKTSRSIRNDHAKGFAKERCSFRTFVDRQSLHFAWLNSKKKFDTLKPVPHTRCMRPRNRVVVFLKKRDRRY